MQYADSVHQVLLRKINRAEQDLVQLKLDYCRFIFGLTHRSQVTVDGQRYHVEAVNVDTMTRQDDGTFTPPEVSGTLVDAPVGTEPTALGKSWTLDGGSQAARG